MSRSRYCHYSEQVKEAIIRSKNPNLFPELKIPRSTAYHWIKKGARYVGKQNRVIRDSSTDRTLRALLLFIRTFDGKVDLGLLSSSEKFELAAALKAGRLKGCLTPSLANQLRDQVYTCVTAYDGLCRMRYPVKLTPKEFESMKSLYESPKYAHMAVCSLAILAKRRGWIHCSPQTWYRYATKFGWQRFFRMVRKPNQRKPGLQADRPNQIWQIDVTKVALMSGDLCNLQVIIDNYSRYIVAWHVSWTISRQRSTNLLKSALEKHGFDPGGCLVSDGGPENSCLGKSIKPLIQQRIARKEIRHANTMIEVFFKTLKHDFLKYQEMRSIEDVRTKVAFFIEQHNNVIPRVALQGRKPLEAFTGELPVFKKETNAVRGRIGINRSSQCNVCR